MDQERFDRLTVAFGRLRERGTRRDAIRALLGGAAVAAAGSALDAEAHRRNRKKGNCKNYGGRCGNDNDCCSKNCINGFCFAGGGGGGGGGGGCRAWGQGCSKNSQCCSGYCQYGVCTAGNAGSCNDNNDCPYNYRCCNVNGLRYCVLNGTQCCNDGNCGGGGGTCGSDFTRCDGQYGGTMCCPQTMKCCGNGACCPDTFQCGGPGCMRTATDADGRQSQEIIPFTPAAPPWDDSGTSGPDQSQG